jgi:hypothetical protein
MSQMYPTMQEEVQLDCMLQILYQTYSLIKFNLIFFTLIIFYLFKYNHYIYLFKIIFNISKNKDNEKMKSLRCEILMLIYN